MEAGVVLRKIVNLTSKIVVVVVVLLLGHALVVLAPLPWPDLNVDAVRLVMLLVLVMIVDIKVVGGVRMETHIIALERVPSLGRLGIE